MSSVPSVYSTGINDFYNPLASGSLDFHYSLTQPGTPIGSIVNATVADTTGTGWITPWDNSRWIAANQDPATPQQIVTYYTAFNLDRFDASTAVITGEWVGSGPATIYVNGLATPIVNNGTRSAFTLSGPWNQQINWLAFEVSSSNNQNGLLVSMTGNAQPVPEPSAMISIAIGILAAIFAMKWKKACA